MGRPRKIVGLRILVTGASQGIGRALALAAAGRGARVLAAARSAPLLEELGHEPRPTGGALETVQADVTSADDRQRMVEAALQHFGGLDVLINNAGIGATGHFAEAAPERLRDIMEVNFFGLAETTRVFLPLLRNGVTPAIMNISSIVAKFGMPGRSEYSASKFAVQGFSEALRAELDKDGIDVLVVCPGLTQTNFSQNMIEKKSRMQLDHLRGMTSETVADEVLKSLERGRNDINLTTQGRLLAFMNRFLPRLTGAIARRKVRQVFSEEIAARKIEMTKKEAAGVK